MFVSVSFLSHPYIIVWTSRTHSRSHRYRPCFVVQLGRNRLTSDHANGAGARIFHVRRSRGRRCPQGIAKFVVFVIVYFCCIHYFFCLLLFFVVVFVVACCCSCCLFIGAVACFRSTGLALWVCVCVCVQTFVCVRGRMVHVGVVPLIHVDICS